MKQEELILVDKQDNELGAIEKLEAHKKGLLHRAFSVFIFNKKGELLIQKRASSKYHSPDLWSNTCCGHPRPNENTLNAAQRRLKEEMGFSTELEKSFSFIYKAEFDNGLIEHEYDHVFIGNYDEKINFNPEEVGEWKYVLLEDLCRDIDNNPKNYTYWFKHIIQNNKSHFLTTVV